MDGAPLAGALVEFVPSDGQGSSSYGTTDDRGRYQMHFSRERSGAWLGESTVRISTADVLDIQGEEQIVPERVPARYNLESELVRRVEPKANQFDFELSASTDAGPDQAESQ